MLRTAFNTHTFDGLRGGGCRCSRKNSEQYVVKDDKITGDIK